MHPKGYQEQERRRAGQPGRLEQAVYGDGDRADVVQVMAEDDGAVVVWVYGHRHGVWPVGTDPVELERRVVATMGSLMGPRNVFELVNQIMMNRTFSPEAHQAALDAAAAEVVGIEEAAVLVGISRSAFDNRRARGSIPEPDLVRSGRPLWWRSTLADVRDLRVGPRDFR